MSGEPPPPQSAAPQQQPLSSPRYISQLYVIPAVDAAEAGKGQLEISVNQGQVPNNVQMQDAGRCLVTFIPQHAGTYMIDVTFNGLQVHGCPIKVDVRERQVGKPVSAPVFARPATTYGAGVSGTSPPTRGPSSAYFSSASPHVDTASSYAPSPSSPHQQHPRSPPMVAGVHSPSEQRRTGPSTELRSPALVKQQQQQQSTPKGLLGYTVAQYGSKEKIVTTATSTTKTVQQPAEMPAPDYQQTAAKEPSALSPRHKYFGESQHQQQPTSPPPISVPIHRAPAMPSSPPPAEGESTAQFEMTRSAELTLYRERPTSVTKARTPMDSPTAEEFRKEIPIHHIYDRVPDERVPMPSVPAQSHQLTAKSNDLPYAPLDQRARKTVEWIRAKMESQESEGSRGPPATMVDVQQRDSARSVGVSSPQQLQSPQGQIQTHIVEPYSSDIETAMTPGTRRRLLEHSVYKAADLKESARRLPYDTEAERRSAATTDHEESEAPSSRHSSKATTPRLSLKFRGSKDKVAAATGAIPEGSVGFEWGKSKISSKHEVVRRGKEVDVRIDGLKLAKEDQLKVVVLPPSLTRQHQPVDQPAQQAPELANKLKKTGNKSWEVSFRPNDVGTHKVLVFVNNIPHPQTPFPIRVYDASQIVVGDIVPESSLNDTVEFTVDAGRAGFGNLEMAIKDHEGVIIPSHVSQLEAGAAKFLVTFNPSSPGTHSVHITFNKEVVKGSPFEVNIVEPPILGPDGSPMPGKKKKDKKSKKEQQHSQNGTHSKSSSKEIVQQPPPTTMGAMATAGARPMVSKLPSLSRVGKPVELLVTLHRADDLVQAQVHDLDRDQLPVEILQDGPNSRRIQFTPKRVGDHEVEIRIAGVEVDGSPFTCRAYDPAKILVLPIPDGSVDKPVSFVVDASQAGVGNLEVAVNEGKIPSMAHALGQHKYEITFVPKEPIDHQISVRFNNEAVPGSPFICHLISAQQPLRFSASGPGLERIPVGHPTEFFLDAHPAEGQSHVIESLPRVQITDPRGELLPVDVAAYEDEPTRTVVKYTPRSVGNHQIAIKWNGQPIAGSPITAKAFDANCVKLALDGENGQVGRACTFTIDAAKAGAGNMEIIVSVGKRNVPNYVQAEGQARFRVSFTPQEAQEHTISVKFNGVSVPGSPMRCPVLPAPPRSPRPSRSDSESVRTAEHLIVPPPASSTTHHHHAIHEEQQRVPPQIVEPAEAGTQEEELRLVGDMATAQLGQPKRFSIDAPPGTAGRVDCNVVVVGPDKRRVSVEKQRVDGGSFDITFKPEKIGDYHIDIQLNGRSLGICPIVCRCFGSMPSGESMEAPSSIVGRAGPICGRDYMFEVDIPKRTRKEHLLAELYSLDSGQQIPLSLDIHPSGDRALCSFRALQKPQRYQFTLYRDGSILDERVLEAVHEPGPNEPIVLLQFADPILVEHQANFEMARSGKRQELLDEDALPAVQIFDSAGVELPVHLRPLADGHRIRADWQPQSEGRHKVVIKDTRGHSLCGSPLPVTVLDLSAVRVIGLRNDIVGAEQNFQLDWTNSGGQSASVSIQHESGEQVKCTMKRVKRGIHSVAFTPKLPGLHFLTILIDGMELPECPYECVISDKGSARARGDALSRAQRGKTARFECSPGTSTPARAELDVIVTNPQGSPLPVRCYKQQDDSYWVEFTPECCGPHSIEVTFGDEPIHGSPFTCEVVDPKKVQIRGIEGPFALRTLAHFIVNRKSAGNGPLHAELVDPQGEALKMDKVKNSLGEDSFTFVPTKLGVHKLSLKLAGFSVPGSPFSLLVEEQRAPTVYGAALDYAIERGQQASMIFDASKQPGGLKVEVRSPSGERVRHTTNRRPDETTEIAFRPQEVGLYEVQIEFNNRHLHGSPFSVSVVDPGKIVVDDSNFRSDGLLQLQVNQKNVIDVDATAAGPAKLRAEVRDSDGELLAGEQQAQILSIGYGKFQLAFTPRRAGKYKIYLYCSELVVPSAYPLLAIAEAGGKGGAEITDGIAEREQQMEAMDLSKVLLRGEGLSHARVKELAEFVVDASELRRGTVGKCTAILHGERADVPVKISALRNQVFKGAYTPLVGGTYQLSVQIDGKHVPGSPSTVTVEAHSHPAELIEVDSRPLKMGIIGEDLRTIIDARRAGPGQISAQCSGPNQAEYCELLDNRDGTYVLRVQPKELGRHTLAVKYENEHVKGSPFTFNVNHPPDPTKVKVYGPGIEHGILHSFKSNFVVETKGAGAGQLTVRVRGPKGAFNVEMQRDRHQERTIHCKYEPREPGDYQVEVKWHGQHVPGSPFFVLIVDTEQELQRFLAGGAPSPTPPSPFVPPGWLPPGPPGLMPAGGPPLPIMAAPVPPPHMSVSSRGGGRLTPGSSVSGGLQMVPMQIAHHHPHGIHHPQQAAPRAPPAAAIYGHKHHY